MRKIELVSGIYSSVLGFGCAPVLGAVGASRARKGIELALDLGINHFDLARSYGFGEAERFLGRILRPRRDQVCIATKFGIEASSKAKWLKPFKPLVRLVRPRRKLNAIDTIKPEIPNSQQRKNRWHIHLTLDAETMTRSLNQSLRELKCEYIDYFFIHEPEETVAAIDEVLSMADKFKRDGKIRAFGLATSDWRASLHAPYVDSFDILQFARPLADLSELVQLRRSKANVMFANMRNSMSQHTSIRELSLQMPKTVFLSSMFTPEHIVENARQFSE